MKKIIFLFTLIIFASVVEASNPVTIVSLTNKCNVYNDKKTIINVKNISLNDGILTSLIPKYTLGKISNENLDIKIDILNGDNIKGLEVDSFTDDNGLSNVYFYLKQDVNLDKLDNFLEFNIELTFLDEVPKSINILGNEVFLSDDNLVCDSINKTDIKQVITEDNHNYLYYLFMFLVLIIGVFLIIFRKKKVM